MKAAKFFSWLFGLAGVCLMAGTMVLVLASLNAEPKVVELPRQAHQSAQALMDAVCGGDYETAQTLLLGQPDLGISRDPEGAVNALVWAAFQDSLEYEFSGECYASDTGLARDVTVSCLDISGVTELLGDYAGKILAQRLEQAEDASEFCDESGQYREAFLQEVLLEAAQQALDEPKTITRELTLQLIHQDGRWQILADKALLEVLSGGMTG